MIPSAAPHRLMGTVHGRQHRAPVLVFAWRIVVALARVIHDGSLRSTHCIAQSNGWTAEAFMNNPG